MIVIGIILFLLGFQLIGIILVILGLLGGGFGLYNRRRGGP